LDSVERIDRKCTAAKFIVSELKEMKAQSVSSVGVERADALDSPWTELVHSLDPGYYGVE
jgi:hypothetical protein